DFNGDGKLDAVIGSNGFGGNVSYPNQINVLAGDGTGSFTTPSVFPISTSPVRDIQILVGDFTYDAKLDVLAYSSPSSGGPTITLLPGNGAGVLGSGTALNPFGTGNARFYLAVS